MKLRLKADDVKTLTDEEWNKEPGKPYLNVNVLGTQVGTGETRTFYYSFAVDFIQQVTCSRRPSVKTEGSTWNQDYALVVPKDDLRQVTLKISDVAHDFAQSVHEANK